MPKLLKQNSFLVLVLSLAFFLFFDQTKHLPATATILPFGEDPYDAVGSFGIQLSFFAALLSLLRGWRPYPANAGRSQMSLLIRTQAVSVLSVAVALVADVVAMARYPSMWMDAPAARMLIALVSGMILLTGLVGWLILRGAQGMEESVRTRPGLPISIFLLLSVLILAFYPSRWRESVPGAIFTALVGMVLFFMQTRALAAGVITSRLDGGYEDLFDDLAAIYGWLKARPGTAVRPFEFFDRLAGTPSVQRIWGWLNPRNHPWILVVLMGLGMGTALVLAEALAEGPAPDAHAAVLVLAVFIGIESAAILLGYALFAGFLGIWRKKA